MQGKELSEDANERVYVGIDVCKARLDVELHPSGEKLTVGNDRQGLLALRRALKGRDVALLVMEATGKLHRLAMRHLSQAGFRVALVNPLRARRFAESIGAPGKTDEVDAHVLAVMGAALEPQGKLRADPPRPEAMEALAELLHARNAAVVERAALQNRLRASQVGFLKAELKRRIEAAQGHVDRLDREMAKRIAADEGLARRYEILVSIPGIGPAVATTLLVDLAELGFLDRGAAAALAGVAPFPDQSGDRDGLRRIQGGRAGPRCALYMAAVTASRWNKDLAAFYKRLREAGKKPKLALVAVMRKLVVLANTLLKENREWVADYVPA
jgi:transposase